MVTSLVFFPITFLKVRLNADSDRRFNGLDALKLLKESGLGLSFITVSSTIGEDVAVKRDVTNEIQLRRQLLQAQKMTDLTRQLLLFSHKQPVDFITVSISTRRLIKMLGRIIGEVIRHIFELFFTRVQLPFNYKPWV